MDRLLRRRMIRAMPHNSRIKRSVHTVAAVAWATAAPARPAADRVRYASEGRRDL